VHHGELGVMEVVKVCSTVVPCGHRMHDDDRRM
jgi:hypothetical protein